jgi:preprotein translocase subunit SecA
VNRVSGSIAASGAYPERQDTRESFADRLIADAGYWLYRLSSGASGSEFLFSNEVSRHAARFAAGNLAPRVPQLRYELRRNGPTPELLAETFGLVAAAFSESGVGSIPAPALRAARLAVEGRIAGLPDSGDRLMALTLAAAAFALGGTPVNLVASSDSLARGHAAAIGKVLGPLGLAVTCVTAGLDPAHRRELHAADVVCTTFRELAHDYLRDRMLLGGGSRKLFAALDRIAGDAPPEDRVMLRGLQCVLVDDADLVLIDDARAPAVISAETDQSQERLLFDQAIELARTLETEADFFIDDEGPALTASGSGRLARLTQPLGGVWSGQQRREELIVNALTALHLLQSGRDYQVSAQRVVFPEPAAGEPEAEDPLDPTLRKLVEVKEGLKLSGRRDVLARISVRRFFRRFLLFGGVCADSTGVGRELWTMYRLKTEQVAAIQRPQVGTARVFADSATKNRAVVESISHLGSAGAATVIAVRTPAAAKTLLETLTQAGFKPALVRGAGDEAERAALAAAAAPGSLTINVHPAERGVIPGPGPGPCLLIAEAYDSTRQVAHLLRAYAPYRSEWLLALDEEQVAAQLAGHALGLVAAFAGRNGEVAPRPARWLAQRIQRRLERAHSMIRAEAMAAEQYLGDLLAFSGVRD